MIVSKFLGYHRNISLYLCRFIWFNILYINWFVRLDVQLIKTSKEKWQEKSVRRILRY